MFWMREHRAFAVEAYFSIGRSIVATKRAFRARFNIPPRSPIPGRNSILSWVTAIQETGSVVNRILGAVRTARTPENVESEKVIFAAPPPPPPPPRRSARKHAAALRLSDRTVRRILHNELQFHPYKLAVVQELTDRDFVAHETACPWNPSPRSGNVLQRRGSLSPFRLYQQTEHALPECWKSTSTSPNASPLSACYRLVRNFVGRDHWSLFFWGKRARCHGECNSIQGNDRRIFPSTSGRNGRRGWVVSTSTDLDGIVERTLPWPPHLSQRRSPLAGALSRCGSMRLFPMGLFEVYRLQRSTTDPSSPEDKHSESHRRNTGGHTSESGAEIDSNSA